MNANMIFNRNMLSFILQNAQIRIRTIKTLRLRNHTRQEMSPVIKRLKTGLKTLKLAQENF